MFRFRLRTLMILLAIGPPVLAGGWWMRQKIVEHYRPRELQSSKAADFDELIRLILETTKPESWDDVGGPGTTDEFKGNLSLIRGGGQTVEEQPECEE
jgi:hypothetical protein